MNTEERTEYIRMMTEYKNFMKDITQTAIASLILPIFFIRDVLGAPDKAPLLGFTKYNIPFQLYWLAMLISIGCGIWYQFIATDYIAQGNGFKVRYPNQFFIVTLSCFFIGVVLFIWGILVSKPIS